MKRHRGSDHGWMVLCLLFVDCQLSLQRSESRASGVSVAGNQASSKTGGDGTSFGQEMSFIGGWRELQLHMEFLVCNFCYFTDLEYYGVLLTQ